MTSYGREEKRREEKRREEKRREEKPTTDSKLSRLTAYLLELSLLRRK